MLSQPILAAFVIGGFISYNRTGAKYSDRLIAAFLIVGATLTAMGF